MIKGKRILVYTGAGISVASGIHGMRELNQALGINQMAQIDELATKSVYEQEKVVAAFRKFLDAMQDNQPTKAHESITELSRKTGCRVFTENHDKLHEKAGIKADHISSDWLRENITTQDLRGIDVVLTLGLSHDDRGFLGWYKQNNPNGRIIAFDLGIPFYLSDLQKTIPALEKQLTKVERIVTE